LFSNSNEKLGKILNFSLPAGSCIIDGKKHIICKGSSKWCEKNCYAKKGFFIRYDAASNLYRSNYIASLKPDFVARAVDEINRSRKKLVRIHVSGEFYSIDYIKKWGKIIHSCPTKEFYVYTRMWRFKAYREALEELRKEPNINVLASTDETMRRHPPVDWCEAGIGDTHDVVAKYCQYQTSGITCNSCRICVNGKVSVVFKKH
jgi:hypothetical protein